MRECSKSFVAYICLESFRGREQRLASSRARSQYSQHRLTQETHFFAAVPNCNNISYSANEDEVRHERMKERNTKEKQRFRSVAFSLSLVNTCIICFWVSLIFSSSSLCCCFAIVSCVSQLSMLLIFRFARALPFLGGGSNCIGHLFIGQKYQSFHDIVLLHRQTAFLTMQKSILTCNRMATNCSHFAICGVCFIWAESLAPLVH